MRNNEAYIFGGKAMNKKKLGLMMASIALIGAVGIGATLAYFTDSEEITNTIETGNVDIELTEPIFSENGDNVLRDVVPNQEIEKDPTITLQSGSEDAYVRVKIDVTGLSDDEKAGIITSIEENLNEGWVKGDSDDLYYFTSVMSLSGTTTTKVFEQIKIPATWTNTSANKEFDIVITAEAIQADWLEEGIVSLSENSVGWNLGEIEIKEYTAPVVTP